MERDPVALSWARRNADAQVAAGDTPVALYTGDVADPALLAALEGMAHLVLCNPPYVPAGAVLPPEVALHDPPAAVFAGPDGLAVIPDVVRTGTRLLREGGSIAIEHDDSHSVAVPALLSVRRVLTDVTDHIDLTGRPRFATARRRTVSVAGH